MSPRANSSPIDRLIADSKQVTADLMTLRHEMSRCATVREREVRGVQDRAYLVLGNLRSVSEGVHYLWLALTEHHSCKSAIDSRALDNGQFKLSSGGR